MSRIDDAWQAMKSSFMQGIAQKGGVPKPVMDKMLLLMETSYNVGVLTGIEFLREEEGVEIRHNIAKVCEDLEIRIKELKEGR